MRTWWIERMAGELHTVTIPVGWLKIKEAILATSAIGPYWTYKEAMQVLHRWKG